MRALRLASDEARAKARTIAEALDVELGSLIEATEGGVEITPPRPLMFDRAAAAATPVQPGEIAVRGTVVVRCSIPVPLPCGRHRVSGPDGGRGHRGPAA